MNWGSTWDFLWHFLIIFGWIAYLLVLFQILTDLFWRDHQTSGVVKALWVFFLLVLPWFGALVYLACPRQGHGRASARRRGGRQEADRRLHQGSGGTIARPGDR